LALVGGIFQQALDKCTEELGAPKDEILGVQLKRGRKFWGIDLWNSTANVTNVRMIDLVIREVLKVTERQEFMIEYKSHDAETVTSVPHTNYVTPDTGPIIPPEEL